MLHFNFRSGKKEKSAKEYRECAAMHMNAVKSSMGTFLQTGVVIVATVVAMIALGRAWFVSNTNVSSTGGAISANNVPSFYLATLASDKPGIYDDSSNDKLAGALKLLQRFNSPTINNLPKFNEGTDHIVRFEDKDYIVGVGDEISLRVNDTSNMNNQKDNGYVDPGARGQITFYIIPTVEGDNEVSILVSLSAYKLVERSNNSVEAQLINNESDFKVNEILQKILGGHIILFQGKDQYGDYTDQVESKLSDDGGVSFSFKKSWNDWEQGDGPIEVTLYWVWPYRFANIVYTGQSESVFNNSGPSYNTFMKWVNDNRDRIVHPEALKGLDADAYASVTMSNANLAKWSTGYNMGDQLIGDVVAYFVWTINAEN